MDGGKFGALKKFVNGPKCHKLASREEMDKILWTKV